MFLVLDLAGKIPAELPALAPLSTIKEAQQIVPTLQGRIPSRRARKGISAIARV